MLFLGREHSDMIHLGEQHSDTYDTSGRTVWRILGHSHIHMVYTVIQVCDQILCGHANHGISWAHTFDILEYSCEGYSMSPPARAKK